MTRIEIYNRMKELGVKHYIMSAKMFSDEQNKYTWIESEWFQHCHYTDESFNNEISKLLKQGFNMFDVIHLHE